MPHGICPHSLISQSCTTTSVEQVRCARTGRVQTQSGTRKHPCIQKRSVRKTGSMQGAQNVCIPQRAGPAAPSGRTVAGTAQPQTQPISDSDQGTQHASSHQVWPMLCRVHGLHWHADASPMACALACCRRAAHPALCCIDHPYASPAQAGLCHGAASMEEQPPRLTTTSTVSKASVTNECAWPTTSTLACGRPRSTAATRAQPSPSSCCSTCGTRRAGRQGGSRRRAVRGVRQCGSP